MSTKEKKIVSLAAEKLNVLYIDTLDTITKARYLDKLKIIDGIRFETVVQNRTPETLKKKISL
jgi:hypothetical protein